MYELREVIGWCLITSSIAYLFGSTRCLKCNRSGIELIICRCK